MYILCVCTHAFPQLLNQAVFTHTVWRFYIYIYSLHVYSFPGGSVGKESACTAGDLGSIPSSERSPGARYGNPLKYSCLENLHGQMSLVDYSPWGDRESKTTERLSTAQHYM